MSDRKTRQGLRDLNPPGHSNPSRRVPYRTVCSHVWETFWTRDCWTGEREMKVRCGLCNMER